jgi:hypothetical protein
MVTMTFAEPTCVTFFECLKQLNDWTDVGMGGMLGIGLLILIGGVLLMMMKSFSFSRSFGVAAIVTALISVLLKTMQLINNTVMSICIVLGVVGVIVLIMDTGS